MSSSPNNSDTTMQKYPHEMIYFYDTWSHGLLITYPNNEMCGVINMDLTTCDYPGCV